MKVMIVVTHLLGTGHLTRAVTLAKAFQKAGHDPLVISGGMPVARLAAAGVPLVQLPAVRSDGVNFSLLLDETGAVASEHLLACRSKNLAELLQHHSPDVLITELFPFGRRILKEEFQTLLHVAKNRAKPPLICASIRDILAPPSKPKKAVFADKLITEFYDGVLVHSDPEITPLELSWPVSDTLRPKLRYTGFVAPPPPTQHPTQAGQGEVVVSAGGGNVGHALFTCAREAARLDTGRVWRILVAGHDTDQRITTLLRDAPANLVVEPARPDFRQMLHHVAISISFCGYNTALDLLQTGCPAVLIPFDDGNEVEQGIRAQALARQPGFDVLQSQDLTPLALLETVSSMLKRPHKRPPYTAAYGADRTVEIVKDMVGSRHAH